MDLPLIRINCLPLALLGVTDIIPQAGGLAI
jgi:hypothetical protein